MIARVKKQLYLGVAAHFRFWANFSLKRWKPRVIAVTGSVGKTTMLRLIELQLGEKAHYSHDANSAYGIAFDIVGMKGVTNSRWRWLYLLVVVPAKSLWFRHKEQFYVVEIDGERPKETEFLASWLKPEVTIWVSLGRSHASYFDGQVKAGLFPNVDEAIAHEFGFLPRFTSKLVIANNNNPLMNKQLKNITANVKTINHNELSSYEVWPDKSEFTLGDDKIIFHCPMPKEVVTQLLELRELAEYLEVPLVNNLVEYYPAPGRNSFLRGIKNTNLIDSSYNAHLISMRSILEMMQIMHADHKWLVISDMTEQGESEAVQHEKLGEDMIKVDAEKYILIGRRVGKYTLPVLQKAGFASKTVHFANVIEALEYIKKELKGGETILFKGSQYLEWIEEKLLLDPNDVKKLPRQEPSAKRRRANRGLK